MALAARLPLLLARRPLWLDEALLAQNIVDSNRGLFEPLINLQTAPVGFVVPVQLLVRVMGRGEIVLRLLPFLASLATVFVLWHAVRRFAGTGGGPLAAYAAAFAALSPVLVRYGNELKPYASDALLGAIAIWLTLWAVESLDWRRWGWVIAAGTVIVVSSVPGIFLMCGVALAVLCARDAAPFLTRVRMIALALLIWLSLFAVIYVVFYSAQAAILGRVGFSTGFGMRLYDNGRAFVAAVMVGESAEAAFPPGTVAIFLATVVAGLVGLVLRYPRSWLFVMSPFVALAAAQVAGRWPLLVRTLLWCLPSAIILVAVACDEVRRRLPSKLTPAGRACLPLLLLVPATYQAWGMVVDPPRREDTVAAFAVLAEQRSRAAADATPPVVYVAAHGSPACRYYSPGVPDRWVCEIDGYRVVVGDWTPLNRRPENVREWVVGEAALIRREMSDGGWLLLVGSEGTRSRVLEATDSLGYRRAETHEFEGVDLVRIER